MGDYINAGFELVGALFTWRNALQLWRERELRGVYWPTWAFFAAWGAWNLVYYPSLGQWWSFVAGIALVTGNVAWVCLAVRVVLRAREVRT
jgi:polyferredoxin